MLDVLSFETVWGALHGNNVYGKSVAAFVRFLEQRLGGQFTYDASAIPLGNEDLLDLFELAERLKAASVITSYARTHGLPDEPPLMQWKADIVGGQPAGGISIESDRSALTSTLAEALERYLWRDATDYFRSPVTATTQDIARYGRALTPESFAGYSPAQRAGNTRLGLRDDAEYLWILGRSLGRGDAVWVPAQVVSGMHGIRNFRNGQEPVILEPITTGLATGPTREFALLNGALEIIERDAFMITWLNRITPARIELNSLKEKSLLIGRLLDTCARYGLHLDALSLPTDAPAHAVCAVVTDLRAKLPPRTVGLKAHRDLARAVVGAALEALRMRHNTRWQLAEHSGAKEKNGDELMHTERLRYFAFGERYKKLDFLIEGPPRDVEGPWERSSASEHLARIVQWCDAQGYECVSVPMTKSAKNVSPWHVEMVVMPDLIPIHQNEKYRYAGGERRLSVPKLFGYTPRAEAYFDEPHPFA